MLGIAIVAKLHGAPIDSSAFQFRRGSTTGQQYLSVAPTLPHLNTYPTCPTYQIFTGIWTQTLLAWVHPVVEYAIPKPTFRQFPLLVLLVCDYVLSHWVTLPVLYSFRSCPASNAYPKLLPTVYLAVKKVIRPNRGNKCSVVAQGGNYHWERVCYSTSSNLLKIQTINESQELLGLTLNPNEIANTITAKKLSWPTHCTIV